MKIARNISISLVCVILGIMLAWQFNSINNNQDAMTYQNKRAEDLKDDLIKLQKSNSEVSVM